MMRIQVVAILMVLTTLCFVSVVAAQQTITRGGNISADIAHDGRVAIDLAGDVWIVPPGGGEALPVTANLKSAQRPRWSPDSSRIAYHAVSQGSPGLFLYDFATQQSERVSRGEAFDMRPAWHPGGERLVYSSDATGEGFDLWEVDLPSGLHWRLSHRPGDETDAAWSTDGRDLVYVHRYADEWALILRRHGHPEETLLTSTQKIAGPAWRPDGSLITFFHQNGIDVSIDMVILSEPRLVRTYASGEAFGTAAVSWLDRHRMIYTAGGQLRQRLFNSWSSSALAFEATLATRPTKTPVKPLRRRAVPRIDEPPGRLIIRAARLYDGIGGGYQFDQDIVIDGGRITALEAHSSRPGEVLIDMGDLTVLPGYIDAIGNLAPLAGLFGDALGPVLLTTGVTTLVAEEADDVRLNALWSGKEMPGPRLLSQREWPVADLRSMADSTTTGLGDLLQSRQARLSRFAGPIARRFSEPPDLSGSASDIVIASHQNGLPAGIGLHAEFLALVAARLTPEQALKAAGVNAAGALGLDPLLGRIAVGATADLVFVDGDPLSSINDALKIVAVVRNGRFFSVSGLIDRVPAGESVE
ncbi:MAG: amidohydrolase family protein [Woeseiaceae bacterium]